MNLANLQTNIILAPYTSFKIGGPARFFVVVKTMEELVLALAAARNVHLPWVVLGGGSDVLIADSGFPGLVIKSELRGITIDDAKMQVSALSGTRLSAVMTQALQHELSGFAFAVGVPASVGGAIWANLGARGSAIEDILIETTVMDPDGATRVFSNADCRFGYRDSIFKHERFVIVDALFQLRKEKKEIIQQQLALLQQSRQDTQDITAKSAGCVFRNPVDQTNISAAALIDACELKGMQIGGAQVSDIHANFIINTGSATAEDVVMLISLIKQKVRDQKGVQLMEEIEYVGF